MILHFFLYLQWKSADMTKHFILHLNPFSTRRFAQREKPSGWECENTISVYSNCKSRRSNTRHVLTTWRETTSFRSMGNSHHAKTISLGFWLQMFQLLYSHQSRWKINEVLSLYFRFPSVWTHLGDYSDSPRKRTWKINIFFVLHHHLIVGSFRVSYFICAWGG